MFERRSVNAAGQFELPTLGGFGRRIFFRRARVGGWGILRVWAVLRGWVFVFVGVAGLMMVARGQSSVTLGWNPSTGNGITNYHVYYGGVSQTYTNVVSAGTATNVTITGLKSGATYYFAASAVNNLGLESVDSNEISYTLGSSNTPPVISSIASLTVNVGVAIAPIAFTVSDAQTAASNLTVTASSSNSGLLPNGNIILGGSGTNRTVTLSPAVGQTGTATVTLTVCDPTLCASTNFLLTVNALAPAIALSSPANGAVYQAPATINLSATVTPNGHNITQVQYYSGAGLVGTATVAPYNVTWSGVSAGTYSLTGRAVYDAGSTVSSSPITIVVQGLPPPWQTVNIGTVGVPGSATASNGLFTVQGAGNVSGSADNFRFVYQTLSGDGEIREQIESMRNGGSGGIAGAMIRENLTSGGRYALMGVTPAGAFRWQRRSSTGSGTSSTRAGSASLPNAWTRVVRSGNTFSGYKSSDGVNWTLVNSSTIGMATNIYVGLAVASGSTSNLNTSVFTNVTVFDTFATTNLMIAQ
jgi:hypothetical protein